MSFLSVAQMVADPVLLSRITGCVALENERDPELWTQRNKWGMAAQPGWGDAWEYAINSNKPLADLGADPAVITDGMILSGVQAINNIRTRG